jgi:multidrug efflux pump subunit AcrA (membrane-fusion protein)
MKKISKRNKWIMGGLILIAVACGVYFWKTSSAATEAVVTYSVINTVSKGAVSTGIEASGEIVAANKLDLDVYKQTSRIEAVNFNNGGHVKSGEVILSFDKSDAYVSAQSSKVDVLSAELSLEAETKSAVDPNTKISTIENQIVGYKKTITDTNQAILDARRDFINIDAEVEPYPSEYNKLIDVMWPKLSGRYVSDIEGEYDITVYASNADSGYSIKVTGLEDLTESVVFNTSVKLGSRGLKISFPTSTKSGDKWVVYVPNTSIATYSETKTSYELKVSNLEKTIADAKVNIENAEQDLDVLKRTDTSSYRNLDVEKATSALLEAKQKLTQSYDMLDEQNIKAPFSGTIDGMENVVVGATPTKDSNDPITLGTLISDEFLVKFSLSAVDVSKITLGQKVLLTVTSFQNSSALEAVVTEISSLPESSGVAQYAVQALITVPEDNSISLREGLLADVEVVQKEVTDVVRIPSSAIAYEQGKATVKVIESLNEAQQQTVDRLGILRSDSGTINSFPVQVTVGLTGAFYVEITGGLEEGDLIIVSSNEEATAVVQQQNFGPGGGTRNTTGSDSASSRQKPE